jgi:hypothetical protein
MRPGSAVALARYTHRRPLEVLSAPEGSSRYRLGAEDLARARSDLADLRVVDDGGMQQPFLVEHGAERVLGLEVGAPRSEEGRSRYQLELSAAPLFLSSLSIEIGERFADRAFRIEAKSGGRLVTLASGRLRRRPDMTDPARVALDHLERVSQLWLVVDDGDDAPLSIATVRATLPTADLYLVAPPGRYRLMLGDAQAEAARYELAGARDLVLALPSGEVTAGALSDNPAYAPPPVEEPTLPLRIALWAVLALAVLALGAVTLRAAAADTPRGDAREPR